MTTYADAKTPKTQAALRVQFLAALAAGDAPVAGWSARAPQRIFADDFSANMASESEIRALLAKMVDLRELEALGRDWCRAWMSWFGEDFIPALPAYWDFPCTSTSLPVTVHAGDTIIIQAGNGQFYELAQTADAVLPATLRFKARSVGTVGNGPLSGGKIITGPAGFAFNGSPVLFTAGRDEESIAAAITRCLAKWSVRGAGWTLDAYDYFIPTAAPTVTRWKVLDDNPYGPGTVGVIVANASGPATVQEVADVQTYLRSRSRRSLGSGQVTVTAAGLDALALNIQLLDDGTNANLVADAEAALALLAAPYAIGPAVLSLDIVRAVALGARFDTIDVDDGSGNLTTITVNIPGFTGAGGIISCDLGADHTVPSGDVLVLSPTVTT